MHRGPLAKAKIGNINLAICSNNGTDSRNTGNFTRRQMPTYVFEPTLTPVVVDRVVVGRLGRYEDALILICSFKPTRVLKHNLKHFKSKNLIDKNDHWIDEQTFALKCFKINSALKILWVNQLSIVY